MISLLAALFITQGMAQTEVATNKFSGFLEVGNYWYEKNQVDSGTQVKDAALYLDHTSGNTALSLDLPFSRVAATDTDNPPDGTPDQTGSNFKFAEDKAQAFITYTQGALTMTLGQFDTIFGYELNDLKNVYFTDQCLVYKNAIPVTHAGLLLNWSRDWYGLKLLAANANGMGSRGRARDAYGTQINVTFTPVTVSLGYLDQNDFEGMRSLFEFLTSAKLGASEINLEYDINRWAGVKDDSTSFMAHGTTPVRGDLSAGLRAEWLSKFPTFYENSQYTVGGQYKLTRELKAKFDYSVSQKTVTKAAKEINDSGFAIAAQYVF